MPDNNADLKWPCWCVFIWCSLAPLSLDDPVAGLSCWWWSLGLKMTCIHTGSSISPQSRLLILSTFCILTLHVLFSSNMTVLWLPLWPLPSLLWSHACCNAILSVFPFDCSPCSIILLFKFLLISPTCTFSQSRQGTLYATLLQQYASYCVCFYTLVHVQIY